MHSTKIVWHCVKYMDNKENETKTFQMPAFRKTEFCSKPMIRNSSFGIGINREPLMMEMWHCRPKWMDLWGQDEKLRDKEPSRAWRDLDPLSRERACQCVERADAKASSRVAPQKSDFCPSIVLEQKFFCMEVYTSCSNGSLYFLLEWKRMLPNQMEEAIRDYWTSEEGGTENVT